MSGILACITKAGDIIDQPTKDRLIKEHQNLIDSGMDDREAAQKVINKFATEYGKGLHKELNDLKTFIKVPTSEEKISTRGNAADFQPKQNTENAIQEQGAGGVLQHTQEGTGISGGERGGMEPSQQGNEITGTQPQEKSEVAPKEEVGGEQRLAGAHHNSLNKVAERLGLPKVERGQVLSPQEYTKRGKLLYENGADYEAMANEFEDTGKVNADMIGVAKARTIDLAKIADDARIKFGKNSQEFKDAQKAYQDWSENVMKPMGTKFGEIGRTLMGEEDLDTGSYVSVKSALENETGKPATPEQEKRIEELTKENAALKIRADKAEKENIEETDKELGQPEEEKKKTFAKTAKKAADTFRKLKQKPFTFKDENGNDIDIQKMGVGWNDIVELGAKAIEKTGEIADGVAAVLDKVSEAEWYKNLSDRDRNRFINKVHELFETPEYKKLKSLEKQRDSLLQLVENKKKSKPEYNFTEEESKKAKELESEIADLKGVIELGKIQDQFVDKRTNDKTFTREEAVTLWDYAKRTYINKGDSYFDAVDKTATDTGLTHAQVVAAFETKKTKPMSDEMWASQSKLRIAKIRTKDYIESQNHNPFIKAVKKLSSYPRAITTFGHGHIYGGTHYPMGFVTPADWAIFFKGIGKMGATAYGSDAHYEKQVRDMTSNPNYIKAQKWGLQNDVENTNTDDFEQSSKVFGRLSKSGTRGFLGLKWTRQMMFDRYWDGLRPEQKTEAVGKEVAQLINLATGASNLKISPVVKEGLFSAQMEAARWGRLFRNPARAVDAAARITASAIKGEELRPQDVVFLKIWGSRVGQQLATMASLLGAAGYIQNKLYPNNKINLTDPSRADFWKLKIGNTDVDLSGGLLGVKTFLWYMAMKAATDKNYSQEKSDIGGKLISYGRGKLAPLYGDVLELALGTDYAGNPLPKSMQFGRNLKPSKGHHTLDFWKEYMASKAPIPVADALNNVFEDAKTGGMSKTTTQKVADGIIESMISFGVGVHTTPSYPDKGTGAKQSKDPHAMQHR